MTETPAIRKFKIQIDGSLGPHNEAAWLGSDQ